MRTLGDPIAILSLSEPTTGVEDPLALRVAIQGFGTAGVGLADHGVAHNRIA